MKSLLILRHAKSSWDNSSLPDRRRPLNKRGRRDAPRMGELLTNLDLVPDLIVCSSATRAKETAKLLVDAIGLGQEVQLYDELYAASPEEILGVLQTLPERVQRAMTIGHNPGLEELVQELTGEFHRLPTAAIAHLRLPIDSWEELQSGVRCELAGLWRPKELDD